MSELFDAYEVIFSMIGLYAAILTTLGVIGSRGRTVEVGCEDVLRDRVIVLSVSDLEFLDSEKVDPLAETQEVEILALGGF